MNGLQDNIEVPALATEILALSGSRGGTVRKARWPEIDFSNLTWTRPPEHMKQRRNLHEHAIHITPGMLRIFRFLYAIRTDDGLIFPSLHCKVLESNFWKKFLPENTDGHGLRTDLETWRQELTTFPTDVGAVQLDHVIRDAKNDLIPANLVTRSYARSPLFNKRCKMMNQWDLFLTGGDYGRDLLEQWKARKETEAAAADPEAAKLSRREYIKSYMKKRRAEQAFVTQPGRKRGRPRKTPVPGDSP